MINIYDSKDSDSLEKSIRIRNLAQAARYGMADLKDLIPLFFDTIKSDPQEGGNSEN